MPALRKQRFPSGGSEEMELRSTERWGVSSPRQEFEEGVYFPFGIGKVELSFYVQNWVGFGDLKRIPVACFHGGRMANMTAACSSACVLPGML